MAKRTRQKWKIIGKPGSEKRKAWNKKQRLKKKKGLTLADLIFGK